ncbi:MAG: tetratricopeptide repeat protein [Pseudomonadota bacterium]|nr:tetratricopeptide repeat protein [Pseudomonadota bacterium]MDO7710617.1 tetratricopeptide repeat protein [Pseudomonadota bacterium]
MMMVSVLKLPLLVILLLMASATMAKQDSQYLLTEKTYKALSAAQTLMEADKFSAAETQLKSLLDKTESSSYERAVVQQTLGYLYSSLEDYTKASSLFQQALDSNALPEKVSNDLLYNLAQLYLADQQYNKGIVMLEKWLKAEASPPNSAHVLLASAYYRVKNYKKTVEHINVAIKNDKSVKETWYQVLLAAHLELKQYKSAISVLETLITLYPYQTSYWSQLSALYLQQNKEFTAMAVKMLAQRLELGDAKTLISLADMYRYLQIPYKSAQLLTQGINDGVIQSDLDNLNRLADSWLAAKEALKAIPILDKITALDDSGESDLKYSRILFGLEQWQNAEESLAKSLTKLNGKRAGTALLLLGMTQFHLGQLPEARASFTKAVKFENERNQAGQWLRHVDNLLSEGESDEG